jgi:hypothetical protein
MLYALRADEIDDDEDDLCDETGEDDSSEEHCCMWKRSKEYIFGDSLAVELGHVDALDCVEVIHETPLSRVKSWDTSSFLEEDDRSGCKYGFLDPISKIHKRIKSYWI